MGTYKFIETNPKKEDFHLFMEAQNKLYSKELTFGKHQLSKSHLSVCVVLLENDKPIGRYAFYENKLLTYKKYKTATIGSYECINNDSAASVLLNHAKSKSIEKGYNYILGPMDGSTWNNFRFSKNNNTSSFFLEPYHHKYYNDQFIKNGFETVAQYLSNIDTNLYANIETLKHQQDHFESLGLTIRNIDLDNFEKDLFKIANFSNDSFSENFLFTPILESDFVEKYLPLKSIVDPELIILVEDKNKTIQALAFSIKDLYDISGKTVIYKTIGRRKLDNLKGIGQFLVSKSNEVVKKKGYTKSIQAFMIDDNPSARISEKIFETTSHKQYTLYGTTL